VDVRCRIELLGGLRVVQGERVVTRFQTQKTASLLAYLAYHLRQNHPREVLIEMLWPETEPGVGRHRLSMALSSLRHQLEPPGAPGGTVLQADRFHIRLNPAAISTDVAEFEESLRQNDLQRAIALYGGPLLPGYYEEWIVPQMMRLEEIYTQACQQREARQKETLSSFPAPDASIPAPLRPTHPVHLPLQFTRFFGREKEIARLVEMLTGETHSREETANQQQAAPTALIKNPIPHLLTLTGPGGIGKTRLAIEVAGRLTEDFPGGLWFVPLADLSDPRLIPASIVDALRLHRSPNREPLDQVVEFLNGRNALVLLLLDNLEHLLSEERRKSEDGAAVIRALLERTPLLTCLVTSRQLLGLEGERECPVAPLPFRGWEGERQDTLVSEQTSIPDTRHPSPSQLMPFASVQLFADRAQAIKADFQVTKGNAAAIARLCDRLEGLPLAIELAAARANVLTPSQMLSELERRFDFLVSRRRDATERHRTLRAAIEWSYRLLSPGQQRFFARLSVFRGGWMVEAAEAVCEELMALDYLAELRECSLVLAEEREGESEMRFRMLETLREFAQDQMSPAERAVARRRHLDFFLKLAEEAGLHRQSSRQGAWLDRLETEHDNLRGALGGCEELREVDRGLQLYEAMLWFWWTRGHLLEGRSWAEWALSQAGLDERSQQKAWVLSGAGTLAFNHGDFTSARTYHEQSLSIMREIGDQEGIVNSLHSLGQVAQMCSDYASAKSFIEESLSLLYRHACYDRQSIAYRLTSLGNVASDQGDYASARAYLEQSLSVFRKIGNPRGIGFTLESLGNAASGQGDYSLARAYFEESLSVCREYSDPRGIAYSLLGLGGVSYSYGDCSLARTYLEESLSVFRRIGDRRGIAFSLEGFADLASLQEEPEQAARLWGAAEALREAVGSPMLFNQHREYDRKVAQVQARVGKDAFRAGWVKGRAMTLERAIAYALEEI
jgi:predicted ATPase